MRFKFVPPQLTLGEKWCTGTLCTFATAIWVAPSGMASWADVSAITAISGATIPAGVAAVFWLAKSAWASHDDRVVAERQAREAAEAEALRDRRQAAEFRRRMLAERVLVREHRRPSPRPRTIEGEFEVTR